VPTWQLATVIGFAVGLAALIWTLGDLRRIPAEIWSHSPYCRNLWTAFAVVGYLVGGWPALVVAAAWRLSRDRADLVDDFVLLAPAEGARERD
jgi:hypothetical protein